MTNATILFSPETVIPGAIERDGSMMIIEVEDTSGYMDEVTIQEDILRDWMEVTLPEDMAPRLWAYEPEDEDGMRGGAIFWMDTEEVWEEYLTLVDRRDFIKEFFSMRSIPLAEWVEMEDGEKYAHFISWMAQIGEHGPADSPTWVYELRQAILEGRLPDYINALRGLTDEMEEVIDKWWYETNKDLENRIIE